MSAEETGRQREEEKRRGGREKVWTMKVGVGGNERARARDVENGKWREGETDSYRENTDEWSEPAEM